MANEKKKVLGVIEGIQVKLIEKPSGENAGSWADKEKDKGMCSSINQKDKRTGVLLTNNHKTIELKLKLTENR